MTTPARYPTTDEVFAKLVASWADQERPAYDEIIQIAIDIERERVEKEAGVPVVWQWRDARIDDADWTECSEGTDAVFVNDPRFEFRALVVQNSASNPLSPGEYFRCDECHEPAGTRQVCRSCVRLEIERDDAVESQNSAVKVPDGLIESLSRNWQISDDVSVCGVHREAVDMAITILQSLTHPTETPR